MIAATILAVIQLQNPNEWFDVTSSKFAIFNLKDSTGRKMDCLKLVQSSNKKKFYGVYHALQDDVFHLWLAESYDAKSWKPIRELGTHSHQGTMSISKQGQVIVAWEKDAPGKGNHLHLAFFQSERDLEQGKVTKEKDLERTYSPSAEGTPSFDKVNWTKGLPEIILGFHYWRNSDVDRQAVGILDSKWNWTCQRRPAYDEFVEGFGVKGNIGDRDVFQVKDQYTVVEGMTTKGDWSSWGLYLINNTRDSCAPVQIRTPKGSRSFANPNVTVIGDMLFVTMFLPSQGNDPSESGELIYAINWVKPGR
jgi:hypothetical protein